jgi:peptide/nickel transport system substrate-binding protein
LSRHDIDSITVLDEVTVRVRFASWRASQSALDGYEIILPKHRLAGLDPKQYARWDFWTHPVGNGPYRFARYVPHTMMQLDANPDYYRDKPRFEHVVLKFVQGDAMTELLSGNVDVLPNADPGRSPADGSWRRYSGFYGHQVSAIAWNNVHPILRDPGVRRALTLAINRRELTRLLNLPDVIPILDGPFTRRMVRRGKIPDPLPYDPDQAEALFDAAGWRRGAGRGARARDGQPFQFTLLVMGERGFSQAAVYVQEALRHVGVEMEVQGMDNGVVRQRFHDGQFDAVLMVVAAGAWRTLLGAHSPLGYRNARVAQLLERVPMVSDAEEEDEIDVEVTRILRSEVPVTVLFPRVTTTLASRRVHGLSSPWRVNPIWSIEDLSLDDGRH